MRPNLSKIMPSLSLNLKDWWYDNPDCWQKKDFETRCPYYKELGTRRMVEYRGRFIDKLTLTTKRELNFSRGPGYNNPTPKVAEIREYILSAGKNNPLTHYGTFMLKMFHTNSDKVTRAFAKSVSPRVFNETVLKMRKRGMIPPKRSIF